MKTSKELSDEIKEIKHHLYILEEILKTTKKQMQKERNYLQEAEKELTLIRKKKK